MKLTVYTELLIIFHNSLLLKLDPAHAVMGAFPYWVRPLMCSTYISYSLREYKP